MGFSWNIIGQDNIIDNLTNLREKNVLPNSFIFTGLDGIGKLTLALEFTKYLNCKGTQDCDSCSRIENLNHPDLILINTDSQCSDKSCCKNPSGNIIKNCVINENVISSVKFNPLIGDYKVIVINEADKLSKVSYESILKTLEEVSGKVLIILLVKNINNIPDTIISRCQLWKLKNISKQELKEKLLKKFPDKYNDINQIISFGAPTIGESIEMLNDPIFFEERQNCIERVIHILNSSNSKKLEYSKDLVGTFRKDKERLYFELSIWKNLFHEILNSKNLDDLINNFSSLNNLISINKIKIKKNVNIILKTEKMIRQNVNPTLCLDNMMLSMETK